MNSSCISAVAYKMFAFTIFIAICLILGYRVTHVPAAAEDHSPVRYWAWIGMFMAELWFGFYWIITQSVRWNVTYRYPFIDRLSQRYEDMLPGVDIFVCTADPSIEPPTMVINTVLSLMSYNYPPEKLSVYLSDDGGSKFTFYALLEASQFAKHWIPFCKKHAIEPRSPEAYFAQSSDNILAQEWLAIKKLYKDMKIRLEEAIDRGSISKDIRDQHKGFSEWNSTVTKHDHQSIVQIIVDGRNSGAVDNDGNRLPTLVYMAREKRPHWPHNFKAGAMNALIRVSSEISNGSIILNLDCDMYSNNSDAVREAICFFMDEEQGHQNAYVQFPQRFHNTTKNDIYFSVASVAHKIELAGMGGHGTAMYCGTGCFHRRQSLSGMKYSEYSRKDDDWRSILSTTTKTVIELEESSKSLANCIYEKDTLWGKEMGLIYGCAVEDIVTGMTIQCRGWKSIYYSPKINSFLGVVPNTLEQTLVQCRRWSDGMFQIFFSKYCPFVYGHGKISLGAQMGYCNYLLWAPNSFPTLYYVLVPSLCLLHGIPLFPKVSSLWFLSFAYVCIARNACSIVEAMACGDTLKGWWNSQRMLLIRRMTSCLFGFTDVILRQLKFSPTTFAITSKVVDDQVLKRYEEELMEFGTSSTMFVVISTVAMIALICLVGGIRRVILEIYSMKSGIWNHPLMAQIMICLLVVMINVPVYGALFLRRDDGRIPTPVMVKSVFAASMVCLLHVIC